MTFKSFAKQALLTSSGRKSLYGGIKKGARAVNPTLGRKLQNVVKRVKYYANAGKDILKEGGEGAAYAAGGAAAIQAAGPAGLSVAAPAAGKAVQKAGGVIKRLKKLAPEIVSDARAVRRDVRAGAKIAKGAFNRVKRGVANFRAGGSGLSAESLNRIVTGAK